MIKKIIKKLTAFCMVGKGDFSTTRIIPLLFLIFILSACGQRNLPTDKATADGTYFYRNEALGFSILFPKTFEHYQTQRTSGVGYIDLEIFVPTSDLRFGKQVQGYATPVTLRVFEKNVWEEISQGKDNTYKYLGEKKDKVYTITFWELAPSDWQADWSGSTEETIINSFEIE